MNRDFMMEFKHDPKKPKRSSVHGYLIYPDQPALLISNSDYNGERHWVHIADITSMVPIEERSALLPSDRPGS